MRNRVIRTQAIQRARYGGLSIRYNSELTGAMLRRYCVLSKEASGLLHRTFEALGWSVRSYDRILKIARTIADLEGLEAIETTTSQRRYNIELWIDLYDSLRIRAHNLIHNPACSRSLSPWLGHVPMPSSSFTIVWMNGSCGSTTCKSAVFLLDFPV